MFRPIAFCGALFAAVLAFAQPAHAQEEVYGAYCGEVTWAGQAPMDVWVIFLVDGRWSAPVSVGPFTDIDTGTRAQNGVRLEMSSSRYAINASAVNGRIVGDVTATDGRRGTISMTQMVGTGGGLRSSSIPPDFSIEAAQGAVNGDITQLQRAVTWAWTPQGSTYWRNIYNSGGPLPDHAVAALNDWIRREQSGERPACDAQ